MFVNVDFQLTKSGVPLAGARLKWSFTARGPINLGDSFESVLQHEVETDENGLGTLVVPSSSFLASRGISPASILVSCVEAGIKHTIFIPDEDCDLDDLVGMPPVDFPSVPPVFRNPPVWLSGNGAPLSNQGRDGDLYLDLLSANAWQKVAGVWVFKILLRPDVVAPHSETHAIDGSDPITPEMIGAAALAHSHAYSSLSGLPTLGSAAARNVGTGANNIIGVDGNGRTLISSSLVFGGANAINDPPRIIHRFDSATPNGLLDIYGDRVKLRGYELLLSFAQISGLASLYGNINLGNGPYGSCVTIGQDNADNDAKLSIRANDGGNGLVLLRLRQDTAQTRPAIQHFKSDGTPLNFLHASGDFEFYQGNTAPILHDRVTGMRYRLKVENGALGVEAL